MSRERLQVCLAVTLAGAVAAIPASATTYVITVEGTVSYDQTYQAPVNGFHPSNPSLLGNAFTLTYTLNMPLPADAYLDSYGRSSIHGGSKYGTPSPLSAVFTSGAFTKSFAGAYASSAVIDPVPFEEFVLYGAGDQVMNGNLATENYVTFTFSPGAVPGNLHFDTLGTFDISLYGSGGSGLVERTFDPVTNLSTFDHTISLDATTYTVALATAALPEPATWALMVLGFGCAGMAFRRQRPDGAVVTV